MNIKQLRDTYGKTSTFAFAYGIGYERLTKVTKRKPRLAKKIKDKFSNVTYGSGLDFGIDPCETFTLKSRKVVVKVRFIQRHSV